MGFHTGQALSVDELAGTVHQGHVQAHHIGGREQRVQVHAGGLLLGIGGVRGRHHRVMRLNVQAQAPRQARRQLTDGPKADQPQGFAGRFQAL